MTIRDMNCLVIDSCVAVKWFVDEPVSPEAKSILSAYLEGRCQFLAPDLIYAEVSNVLWTQCHRALITTEMARAGLVQFLQIQFVVTPTVDLLDDAMSLALHHAQSVYDCLYIALCRRENCSLVTADEKLFRKFDSALSDVTVLRLADAVKSL